MFSSGCALVIFELELTADEAKFVTYRICLVANIPDIDVELLAESIIDVVAQFSRQGCEKSVTRAWRSE